MKKAILAVLMMCLVMTGCGQAPAPAAEATPTPTPTEAPTSAPTPTPRPTQEATPTPTEEPTPEPTEEPENQWITDEPEFYMEDTFQASDLSITQTTGPIQYTITAFKVMRFIAKTEDFADYYDVKANEECTMVSVFIEIENTSDAVVDFGHYATLTTNTKQQVDPNIDSDYLDYQYHGQIVQDGCLLFTLDKTHFNELTNFTLITEYPYDDDTYDTLGDPLTFEINLADFENEVS